MPCLPPLHLCIPSIELLRGDAIIINAHSVMQAAERRAAQAVADNSAIADEVEEMRAAMTRLQVISRHARVPAWSRCEMQM